MNEVLLMMIFSTYDGGSTFEAKTIFTADRMCFHRKEESAMEKCHVFGKTFLKLKTSRGSIRDYKCISYKEKK